MDLITAVTESDFELQLVGASAGDYAFDGAVADLDDHMGDDLTELQFLDFATETISR